MNLIFISPSFYPATYYGGPIYSLYNLTNCISNNGFQVFVATTNCNGKEKLIVNTNKYINLDKNLNVKYYGNGTSRGFSLWMYLMLWKDIIGKDIIYLVSIFSPPTPLTIFLNFLFRKPLILSPRGQLGEWCLKQGNILKKMYLKLIINPVANKITWEATSLSEKEMISKIFPDAKVEVLPSIMDIEEYNCVSDSKRSYSIFKRLTGKDFEGHKIIVSLGRLHKVKGFDLLIESVTKIEQQDLVLLIAGGDFGERNNLEAIIDKFKLKNKVFLVGNIEGKDKNEFLRNADVFALASHHENFGIVYAEALAAGTPIVASRNTPWQEVEKNNCGLWVNNTPEDFANAISYILKGNLKQMGENGRKYVEDNFSCSSVINKFKEEISRVIKTK